MIRLISLLLFLGFTCCSFGQHVTVKQEIDKISKSADVHFIFDSNLSLDMPYRGIPLDGMPTGEAIKQLFKGTDIDYIISGKNVILKRESDSRKETNRKEKTYRIRGRVVDDSGEPVINAAIYDVSTKSGTTTNENGNYVLYLPEGEHHIRVSYVGSGKTERMIDLHRDTREDFILENASELPEVTVEGDFNSPVRTPYLGKRTLTRMDMETEFSLLSTPDLVKTLQDVSGIANGVELTSGLYVHGGNTDENLYLLDGTPIYQTNHSLGLFSAFNVDAVKTVDFYKSGFPARYGGRVSSVTDVRTRDGNMKRLTGLVSLGLIDGRIQMEGPIIKDKTSFNISFRRSWIDFVLKPFFALANKGDEDGEKLKFDYAFHDLTAKVTHNLNHDSKMWLSIYSGADRYSVKDESMWDSYETDTDNRLKWGNVNVALGYGKQLSNTLQTSCSAYVAYSRSEHDFDEIDMLHLSARMIRGNSLEINKNHTKLRDLGIKTDFGWIPNARNHFRFGMSLTIHSFLPQTITQAYYYGDKAEAVDTTSVSIVNKSRSEELNLYVEDEVTLSERLICNAGINYTMAKVRNTCYNMPDPRMSLRLLLSDNLSVKLSFSSMTQTLHRLSSSSLELPTDYWVPTTGDIKPTRSSQFSGGFYYRFGKRWSLSLECYLKSTHHLLQFKKWMGVQPPAALWENNVTEGRGRAYGIDVDMAYKADNMSLSLAYTLSWSKRFFPEISKDWFYEQFDNRHRLNVSFSYRVTDRISLRAKWTGRTGNRVTMPSGYALLPHIPGDPETNTGGYAYIKHNNQVLPSYHRLDVGLDFKNMRKNGTERVWNVSLYNVYCHLNTLYTRIKQDEKGNFLLSCKGFIPIIPSVSYTVKF